MDPKTTNLLFYHINFFLYVKRDMFYIDFKPSKLVLSSNTILGGILFTKIKKKLYFKHLKNSHNLQSWSSSTSVQALKGTKSRTTFSYIFKPSGVDLVGE